MSKSVLRTDSVTSLKTFGIKKINQYTLLQKLGQGSYGGVYQVVEPGSGFYGGDDIDKTFAMKIVDKKNLCRTIDGTNHFVNELEALKLLHHPNIVHLREVIDDYDDKNLYLIM